MAAIGNESKANVFKVCQKIFADSFLYNGNKELRINVYENGEPIQLKMTLTYCKAPIDENGGEQGFGSTPSGSIELTDSELNEVNNYLKVLGLIK